MTSETKESIFAGCEKSSTTPMMSEFDEAVFNASFLLSSDVPEHNLINFKPPADSLRISLN